MGSVAILLKRVKACGGDIVTRFCPPSLRAGQSHLASTMTVPFDVLAFGEPEDFSRPCVDCGRITGSFCDGKFGRPCFAAERVPSEKWVDGQRTPLCTACDREKDICHFCRRVSWCRPFSHPKTDPYYRE